MPVAARLQRDVNMEEEAELRRLERGRGPDCDAPAQENADPLAGLAAAAAQQQPHGAAHEGAGAWTRGR